GIRDFHVTGVQTCALPISSGFEKRKNLAPEAFKILEAIVMPPSGIGAKLAACNRLKREGVGVWHDPIAIPMKDERRQRDVLEHRSEERRVGKEGRRWGAAE